MSDSFKLPKPHFPSTEKLKNFVPRKTNLSPANIDVDVEMNRDVEVRIENDAKRECAKLKDSILDPETQELFVSLLPSADPIVTESKLNSNLQGLWNQILSKIVPMIETPDNSQFAILGSQIGMLTEASLKTFGTSLSAANVSYSSDVSIMVPPSLGISDLTLKSFFAAVQEVNPLVINSTDNTDIRKLILCNLKQWSPIGTPATPTCYIEIWDLVAGSFATVGYVQFSGGVFITSPVGVTLATQVPADESKISDLESCTSSNWKQLVALLSLSRSAYAIFYDTNAKQQIFCQGVYNATSLSVDSSNYLLTADPTDAYLQFLNAAWKPYASSNTIKILVYVHN